VADTSYYFCVLVFDVKLLDSEQYGPCVILVPIDRTGGVNMLYIFVDIKIDSLHFIQTLQHNFTPGTHIALVSTIQFVPTLQV